MRRLVLLVLASTLLSGIFPLEAQTRRKAPVRKPPAPALKVEAASITCPSVLGRGARTHLEYCDVLIGRNPADGIHIKIPPRDGTAYVSFLLHNRHTFSEEEVRARRAYARYTAVVGLLTTAGDLLDRGAVQSEFFAEKDLYERIEGGAGPRGLKAVAPIGAEQVRIEVPDAKVTEVSLLGEKLTVTKGDQTATYTIVGTPIASVSNIKVEYRPKKLKR
ncbi:MAG: hypothetical protein ACM36C_12560 [Acidobacteriota bacterium]